MLVLTRKLGEKIVLGDNIVVTVVKVEDNQVRLAFTAPDQVRILRAELNGKEKPTASCLDQNDADMNEKPAEWLEPTRCEGTSW